MDDYMKLLGHKAKDVITGFEGVVSSISFDLYGCVMVVLTPGAADGKTNEGHWFDHKRIAITDPVPVMVAPRFASLKPGAENGPAEKPALPSSPMRG